MRRGARELKLDLHWRHHFVPPGTRCDPSPDTVYLDVGGQLEPGVVDGHQGGGIATTAELVLRHPEYAYGPLLGSWLKRADDGVDLAGRVWRPALVLHSEPDFDCVVSCLLVERLIEDGAFPAYASALAAYSAEVDRGRYPLDRSAPTALTTPVHLAYLLVQSAKRELGLDDAAMLALGVAMVRRVAEALEGVRGGRVSPLDFTPHRLPDSSVEPAVRAALEEAARSWLGVAGTEILPARLADQPRLFEADRALGRRGTATLPAADGGPPLDVPVWVAPAVPRCGLNKYFVRAAGFPYFVCPIAGSGRVILSLDPTWTGPGGRKPTLRGLGYRLERAESARRKDLDPRIPVPRWNDGTVDNDDPWYDGRGHAYTIVDSPRIGTILSYDEVVALAVGGDFWKTRLDAARLFVILAKPLVSSGPPGGPPPPLAGLAPAVAFWRSQSRDRDLGESERLGGSLPALPPHFRVGREFERTPPEALAVGARRPGALGAIAIVGDPGATLDDLTSWVKEISRSDQLLHVVAIVDPERNAGWPERAGQLLAEMCQGDAVEVPRPGPGDLVVLNGRVVAMNLHARRDDDAYAATVCELMLYAAFQESALAWFSSEVAKSVERSQNSSALRQAFLLLRTQYLCREPALSNDARRAYHGVVGALGLDLELEKVNVEMRSLEQIDLDRDEQRRLDVEDDRQRVEAFLNGVLGLVAITGIIQAVGIEWSRLAPWQGAVMAGGVLLATALIVPRVGRLTRSRRRAEPRAPS